MFSWKIFQISPLNTQYFVGGLSNEISVVKVSNIKYKLKPLLMCQQII